MASNCNQRSVRGWVVGGLVGAALGAALGRRHGPIVNAALGAALGSMVVGSVWDVHLERTDPTCCTYADDDDRCLTMAERELERRGW